MADILETLKSRRSCRSFKQELVDEEALRKIIEAGTYAANGRGFQSAIIVSVTNPATRALLSRMNAAVMDKTDVDPFYGAPQMLIVLADRSRPTYLYDGSLVLGNMMAEAESLGIATCWIHRAKEVFQSDEGQALLEKWGITGDYEGIGHLALGYADKPAPAPAARKDNFVYWVK